ncbi:MAG: hypothetical protein JWL83_72 [Actinomycetia bacterium]|nr:hypothetical protein [Actinomycetes bacterium]
MKASVRALLRDVPPINFRFVGPTFETTIWLSDWRTDMPPAFECPTKWIQHIMLPVELDTWARYREIMDEIVTRVLGHPAGAVARAQTRTYMRAGAV